MAIYPNEAINLIISLNLRKSVGHDNISPYFLRVASTILAPALFYFIETAFCLSIFPKSFKIAKVTSLFKSGNTNNLTNYRSILILTCVLKFVEKLIHQRETNFFKKNLVLIDSRYCFQNNISMLFIDVLTTAYDQINQNKYTGLITLDFKKAFDTVCRKILVSKLEDYGIRGVAHKLISSFLSDRQQYVAYQTLHSEITINSFGAPRTAIQNHSYF